MLAVILLFGPCGRSCLPPPEKYPLDRKHLRRTIAELRLSRPDEDAGLVLRDASLSGVRVRDLTDQAIEATSLRWSGQFEIHENPESMGFWLEIVSPDGDVTDMSGNFRHRGDDGSARACRVNDTLVDTVEEWVREDDRWFRPADPLRLTFGPKSP
jgi:hypothetical protein